MKTNDAYKLIYALHEAIENADKEDNIDMGCITSDLIDAQEFSNFSLDVIDAYLDTTTRIVSEGYAPGDWYNSRFERLIIERTNKLTQKAIKVVALLETLNKVTDMFDDLLEENEE